MTRPSRLLLGLWVAALAAAAPTPPARAQIAGPGPHAPVVSLNFKGGTLAQFVDALRSASPDGVNIVMDQEAADLPVPAMTLKNAAVGAALESVAMLFIESSGDPNDSGMRLHAREISARMPGQAPVYVLHHDPGPGPLLQQAPPGHAAAGDRAPGRRLRVASIQEMVRPPSGDEWVGSPVVRVEQVLSAIDTALSLRGDEGSPADVKYHADTGLIVYLGTPEEIDVIDDVLRNVRDDVMKQRASWRQAADRGADESFKREEAEVRLRLAAQRMDFAREALRDAEALHAAGTLSAEEFAQARQRLAEAEAELQLSEARRRSFTRTPSGDAGTVVVYDCRDFGPFVPEVSRLIDQAAGAEPQGAGEAGVLTLRCGEDAHRRVQALLTTLRRVRANDPALEPRPSWHAPDGRK